MVAVAAAGSELVEVVVAEQVVADIEAAVAVAADVAVTAWVDLSPRPVSSASPDLLERPGRTSYSLIDFRLPSRREGGQ